PASSRRVARGCASCCAAGIPIRFPSSGASSTGWRARSSATSRRRRERVDEPARFRHRGRARPRAAAAPPRPAPGAPAPARGAAIAITLGFCAYGITAEWSKAAPRLDRADPLYVALAFLAVAAYYLTFIVGWIRILAAWEIHVPYRAALQAEMVSMLAKYVP